MKRLFTILTVLFIVGNLGSHMQDAEFFSRFVSPDVLVILDTSGSMTWNMAGQLTYGDGTIGGDVTYLGYDVKHPFYGYASDWYNNGDTTRFGDKSRMHIVKDAMYQIVDEFGGQIRWGLATFYQENNVTTSGYYRSWYQDSGENWHWGNPELQWNGTATTYAKDQCMLRVEISQASGQNQSHINLIKKLLDREINNYNEKDEMRAVGGTPIAPALRGARYWYSDLAKTDNAKWCRGYYVILLTDGEPTYGIDQDTYSQGEDAELSSYNSSSPQWMKNQCYWEAESLRYTYIPAHGGDTATMADIKTFVVGLGPEIATLDTIAIYGGTEHYYNARNADEVVDALRRIFAAIINEAKTFTAGEVTSIQEEFLSSEYEARMYLASFLPIESPFWEGHLRSIKLLPGGMALDSIPDSLVYWDAGESLFVRNPTTRNIYGIKNGSMLTFNSSNFNFSALDVASAADVDTVISLVYSGRKTMDSTAYLSDIFHSAPIRIKSPNYFYHDDDFGEYRALMDTTRTAVIYAGANDGMLHAFDDTNGHELFAVIPENFVPLVKTLRDTHRFYVDADPMAADVWFPSNPSDLFKSKNEWHTVLMVPQGEGGRGITVLDITNPSSMSHLFSFNEDTIGLTTSVPVIYKVGSINALGDTVERFFAFFGGGEWPDSLYDIYDPTSSDSLKGNVIVAIDIYHAATNGLSMGTNFWYIPASSGDESKMVYPFASAGSMINLNPRYDNRWDLLYIPDIAGQLWKVDVRNPDVSSWRARCIFQPPIPANSGQEALWQPAFFRPLIQRDPGYGCLWLFYGTGDRSRIFKENTENRFYAIMDTLTSESYPLTESNLKKISPSGSFNPGSDFPGKKGWYILYDDYGHTDEKTVTYATLLLDTLCFATFEAVPASASDPCGTGSGAAREYSFHIRTGGYAGATPFEDIGSGIPQAPRYSFNMEGEGLKIHQTSDSVWIEQLTGYGSFKRILQWKEE